MLNKYARRAIGKCAADLYDAGNRQESLCLLRNIAEASERQGETAPPPGWGELAEVGRIKAEKSRYHRERAANVR